MDRELFTKNEWKLHRLLELNKRIKELQEFINKLEYMSNCEYRRDNPFKDFGEDSDQYVYTKNNYDVKDFGFKLSQQQDGCPCYDYKEEYSYNSLNINSKEIFDSLGINERDFYKDIIHNALIIELSKKIEELQKEFEQIDLNWAFKM